MRYIIFFIALISFQIFMAAFCFNKESFDLWVKCASFLVLGYSVGLLHAIFKWEKYV